MLKKLIRTLGVMLAIFSVIWIITGSTIEFHQRYVYHNLLTTCQDMILKTSSKDSKKYIKYIDKNPLGSNTFSFLANAAEDMWHFKLKRINKNISSMYLGDLLIPEYITINPHRGPPAI
jgi:hypothetical protein